MAGGRAPASMGHVVADGEREEERKKEKEKEKKKEEEEDSGNHEREEREGEILKKIWAWAQETHGLHRLPPLKEFRPRNSKQTDSKDYHLKQRTKISKCTNTEVKEGF